MNLKVLSELYSIMKMIQESDLTSNYEEDINDFIISLKGYLTSFLRGICFTNCDDVGCIHASYKNVDFKIDVINGFKIIFENSKDTGILSYFENMFNKITGQTKTCSYKYVQEDNFKYVIEWSLNPEQRLGSLNNDIHVQNLQDYYTSKIIKQLGQNVLSLESYVILFGNGVSEYDEYYKCVQIQKVHPNIDTDMLYSWILSCRNKLSLNKKVG